MISLSFTSVFKKEDISLRILLSIFQFLFIFGLALPSFGFSQAPVAGFDAAMAGTGKKGLIVSGKITQVKDATLPNGWKVKECTLLGEVIKGNDEYAAGSEPQTIVFKMVDGEMVRGLVPCRLGMEGVFSIYGFSEPFGLSSFVHNGQANILLQPEADGKLYTVQKSFRFQNKAVEQKFLQANPGLATKALGTGANSSAGVSQTGLTQEQAVDLARYLAKQLYPDQTK